LPRGWVSDLSTASIEVPFPRSAASQRSATSSPRRYGICPTSRFDQNSFTMRALGASARARR
jgi:hypothetical protein